MSLVIIGSIALDDIETPFGKAEKIVGGATPFASLAASYFYEKVKVIGIIGGDFPKSELEIWKEHKINLEGLQIAEDRKNFYWSGKYHNDMNNRDTLETGLNVLEDFDPIYPDSYQDCEYLLLANLSPVTQRLAINRLKNRPKLIVMDTMNFWMDIAMDDLLATIKMVDVLTINDAEARQLSGEYSLVKAANKILIMGPKYLIIKKGEHGALLFHEDKIFPKEIRVFFFDKFGNNTTKLRGDSARFIRAKNLYKIMGRVQIDNQVKHEVLETPELFWSPDTKKIYTDKRVDIKTPDQVLHGMGMDSNQDFSDYTIRKVTGVVSVKSLPQ